MHAKSSPKGSLMQAHEYRELTAVKMAELVRTGEVSPVEIVQAALDSIAATDGAINAWCDVLESHAMERATELESQAARGEVCGPLHGVPIGVKDLFLTAGFRTRKGSLLHTDSVATETAPAVQRLFAAGAIMVGKNTTPEAGWKGSSTSPLYGVTRNPWNPEKTAGGSSSGSAAAVAAGHVPITLGSDGGGSMRIPASFCGIFSMKPTLGRVPTYPLSPSEHLSHAGPMTATVADYALALDAIKGPDCRDPQSIPDDGLRYSELLDMPARPIRCVLAATLFDKAVHAEIARCIKHAFAEIERMPGVEIVNARVDWKDPIAIFEGLWTARGALSRGMSPEDRARLDPGLARMIEAGTHVDLEFHLRNLQDRAKFCREVAESFQSFDILLTPTLPILAFAAEDDGPPDMDPAPLIPWARWTPFTYPFNITGQPAASIPCGWTPDGMPVGLQVIGNRFADLTVLQLCAALELRFNTGTKQRRLLRAPHNAHSIAAERRM